MSTITNPYFWVVISLFGMLGGNTIVSRTRVGSFKYYGIFVVTLVLAPRFIIALPLIEQQRFDLPYQSTLGIIPIIAALMLWLPMSKIMWATSPNKNETLSTAGIYGLVRHPGYLGDILFFLGWAILFGATFAVVATPLWVLAFYLQALIEENSLDQEYGQSYGVYKLSVRSRIVPGLPF